MPAVIIDRWNLLTAGPVVKILRKFIGLEQKEKLPWQGLPARGVKSF
jgi:hypothetical protein